MRMSVYRRYFRVTTGPLIAAVKDSIKVNGLAAKQYLKIAKEIGASDTFLHVDNRLTGFIFEGMVDKTLFRQARNRNGWYPKKTSKVGRNLCKRLKAIETYGEDKLLHSIDIHSKYAFMTSNRMHISTVVFIPTEEIVAFVSIPWKDINPKELEEYKLARAKRKHMSAELDHLLWEPDEHLVAVKEWQCIKEIDEWNESVQKELNA